MDKKKSKKANLDNKRIIFLELAFILVLALVLLVLEMNFTSKKNYMTAVVELDIEVDYGPIRIVKDLKPPKPQKPIKLIESFTIVPNDTKIENEVDLSVFEEDNKIEYIDNKQSKIYFYADIMPAYEGGIDNLKKQIKHRAKYPKQLEGTGIQGKVYVRFAIDKEGNVKKLSIIKSIHPLLDKKAKQIIRSLPKWQPAQIDGKTVAVWQIIPVCFTPKE